MTRRLARLCAAGAIALLAGCGGSSGDGGGQASGSGTATKAQWRKDVNAICRRNEAQSRKIATDVVRESGLSRKQAAQKVLRRTVDAQDELLDDIGAVPAPANLRADFRRFVATIRTSLPLLDRLAATIASDREDPALNRRFARIAAQTRPFAVRNGITDCLADQGSG